MNAEAAKFCRDCRYASRIDRTVLPQGDCTHPKAALRIDIVTGDPVRMGMRDMRIGIPAGISCFPPPPEMCGPEGRWFEPASAVTAEKQ